MADSTSHAALPYPIRNSRYSLAIAFRVSAGTPTDPTAPDTELSSDGGATFADITEEITTGGTNGVGYVTLTGAETNNNIVVLAAKSSNCLTTPVVLYPRVLAIVGSGTLSAGSAGGGTLGTLLTYDVTGCFIRTTGGTGGGGTGGANNQARKIVTYTTSTGAFTVTPNWETTPDATTTYDVLLPEGVTLGTLRTLNPTTAGRTLDVSTGGEAGLDWANVGSPTTSLALTGTTIAVTQQVDVNTVKTQAVTCAAGVTVNTNVGTTQPVNFTGTAASALVKSDTVDIAGVAVSTSTAQIGVNVVNFGGNAGTFSSGKPATTLVSTDVTGNVASDLQTIKTQTVTCAGGVTVPAATLASTTNVTAGTITTVTGNVGGNVTGSVGSVVGAVGSVAAAVTLSAGDSSVIATGTALAGGATSITLQTALGTAADIVGCKIKLTSGTGALQERIVATYNNSTKVVTVNYAWVTNPSTDSVYAILYDNAPKIDSNLKVSGVVLVDTLTTYTNNTPQTGDAFAIVNDASFGNAKLVRSTTPANTLSVDTGHAISFNNSSIPSVAAIGTGGIASTSFAAGAIDATAIATDAIGSDELAASAVTEIAGGVWDLLTSGHTTSGTFGAAMGAAGAAGDPWSTSLPGAYGSGTAGFIVGTNLDVTVGSRSTYVGADTSGTTTLLTRLTGTRASYLDNLSGGAVALAGTALTNATWTNARAAKLDALDTTISSRASATVTPSWYSVAASATVAGYASGQDPATLVLDALAADHTLSGSVGQKISAAGGAADPLLNPVPGAYAAGTAGFVIGSLEVIVGGGSVLVDADYGGTKALALVNPSGAYIGGAAIRAFLRTDWEAGHTDNTFVVATSSTQDDGSWRYAIQLDPGAYTLLYEVRGYAPTTKNLSVS